jgi:hypothetical protein
VIDIKTLKQNMEGRTDGEDAELAALLNDGWEIVPSMSTTTSVESTYGDNDQFHSSSLLRLVTLKRETPQIEEKRTTGIFTPWVKDPVSDMPQSTSLPADVIDAYLRADNAATWQDVGLILFPVLYKIVTGETHPRDLGDEYNRTPHLPADVLTAYHALNTLMDTPWGPVSLLDRIVDLKDAIAKYAPATGDAS